MLLPPKCFKINPLQHICEECEFGYDWYQGQCRRRTQNCWEQDWEKSLSNVNENEIIVGNCKSCFSK